MMRSAREVVLVTGATGRIGRLVVDELLQTGAPVRALTRSPERASLPAGVEVVAGDFTVPESLDRALEEASSVFLVWTAPPAAAPAIITKLASHSGSEPRRVIYLSAPFRTPHPFFQQPNPMRDLHAKIEGLLAGSGLSVTVVRPGMFASNAIHWWGPQIRAGNLVRWPLAAAETAPVDERDVAAAAARLLIGNRHAGGDFVLTGPESLSQAAQVDLIGNAIGRPLRMQKMTPDEFRQETAGIWPGGVADMLLAAWQATLGRPAYVTSAIEEILGRSARTFSEWAAEHAKNFGGSVRAPNIPPDH